MMLFCATDAVLSPLLAAGLRVYEVYEVVRDADPISELPSCRVRECLPRQFVVLSRTPQRQGGSVHAPAAPDLPAA